MSSRLCPICLRSPREGETMEKVRLAAGDLSERQLTDLKRTIHPEPGLYHMCADCTEMVKPAVCARVNDARREDALRRGEEAPASYTPETLPGNMLV